MTTDCQEINGLGHARLPLSRSKQLLRATIHLLSYHFILKRRRTTVTHPITKDISRFTQIEWSASLVASGQAKAPRKPGRFQIQPVRGLRRRPSSVRPPEACWNS